jgi:hypothetical protein
MPKRSNKKKPPKDINKLAAYIVEQTIQNSDYKSSMPPQNKPDFSKKS